MQKILFRYTLLLSALLVGLTGCEKEPLYSTVPQIEFRKFEVVTIPPDEVTRYEQKRLRIFSYVTDGDGDLGVTSDDKIRHNFIIQVLYKLPDGSFAPIPLPDTSFNYNGRFPVLSPEPNKTGPLEVDPFIYEGVLFASNSYAGQTLKFRYFIYDRAMNKSNVVETPEISF